MNKVGLSYREVKEPEFAEMLKRKHEFYNCLECGLFSQREDLTGLCVHPDTLDLTQVTHKFCPYKIKKGG